VRTAHGDGIITSGTFSPTMHRAIALARLPLQVAVGEEVRVAIRDQYSEAFVVKPPFVRGGKILIQS